MYEQLSEGESDEWHNSHGQTRRTAEKPKDGETCRRRQHQYEKVQDSISLLLKNKCAITSKYCYTQRRAFKLPLVNRLNLTLHFGNFTLEFLISLLKAGDLLRLRFNPISYPLGEFFGASVSLKVFAFVYLGAKRLDQILVLVEPVTPSPGTGGTHCRVELVPSQSEERLRLFPLRPAFLAVFPRHDSAAQNWTDQLGYGIETLPAVPHPGESFTKQCVSLNEFRCRHRAFRLEIDFPNFGHDQVAPFRASR